VVPEDGPVLIETTVGNKDIGFVHARQDVAIKVQTFEFTRCMGTGGREQGSVRGCTGCVGSGDAMDKAGDHATDDTQANGPGMSHMWHRVEQAVAPEMTVTAERFEPLSFIVAGTGLVTADEAFVNRRSV
jgi:hypothetical protein